jgi:TusA-related sulfurtransferase
MIKIKPTTTLKFIENVKADATADIVFRMCPMHLLKTQEKMDELKVGEILEILTDYDGALDDLPAWCEKTGNEFLGVEDAGEYYKLYVKKLK